MGKGGLDGLGLKPGDPEELAWRVVYTTLRQAALSLVEDKRGFLTGEPEDLDLLPVNGIHDGDTMRLTCDGEKIKVRLYCIDAPEISQKPWGKESRDYLRDITPKRVELIRRDKDRYRRIIGEVIAGDPDGNDRESLNLAQVASGHAAVYISSPDQRAPSVFLPKWNRPT